MTHQGRGNHYTERSVTGVQSEIDLKNKLEEE
jgi:hypothetical protein